MTPSPNRLSAWRFVIGFGVVSMLADVVYEGARSVVGPYLGSLGASAAVVGVATGAGEAVAFVLRIVTGRLVDRTGRPWGLTILGYLITVVSVPLLAVTAHLPSAVGLVVSERFGKAVRTPARDTMLAHAGSSMGRGRAFAVHEALDQTGAFAGPLLITAALAAGWGYRGGFAILAIPGVLAVVALLVLRTGAPDPSRFDEAADREHALPNRHLPPLFWTYAAFTALLMLGFPTFGLLSFHADQRQVLPTVAVPVLYAVAMAAAAVGGVVFGQVYDRVGLRGLVVAPLLAAVVPWLSFASSPLLVWLGAAVWGLALGVQSSTMRAAVADLVPAVRRGSAYGWFATCYGLAWLGGGALIGWLYDYRTASAGVAVVVIELLAVGWFALRLLPEVRRSPRG
ncbi:MAG: MFS transporter [Actinomycetales bacterium]